MTKQLLRLALRATLALPFVVAVPAGVGQRAFAAAPADATARAQALGDRAREAFQAGDHERAISLYLQAYETAKSAGFLYNIGFIYKTRLGDAELATQYFERVLGEPDADEVMKERCRAHIAELEAQRDAGDGTTGPGDGTTGPGDGTTGPGDGATGPGDGTTGPGDGTTGPGDGKTGPGGGEPVGPIVAPRPSDTNWTPWVVAGSGAALLGIGVGLGIVASGTESDFHAARTVEEKRSLQSDGQTQALVADILMGAGVAAIGVAIVLWVVDGDDDDASSVHVAPSPIPGGAALMFGGRL